MHFNGQYRIGVTWKIVLLIGLAVGCAENLECDLEIEEILGDRTGKVEWNEASSSHCKFVGRGALGLLNRDPDFSAPDVLTVIHDSPNGPETLTVHFSDSALRIGKQQADVFLTSEFQCMNESCQEFASTDCLAEIRYSNEVIWTHTSYLEVYVEIECAAEFLNGTGQTFEATPIIITGHFKQTKTSPIGG